MRTVYNTLQVQVAEPEFLTATLQKEVDQGWSLVDMLYMNNIHVLCVFSKQVPDEEQVETTKEDVAVIKDTTDEIKEKL